VIAWVTVKRDGANNPLDDRVGIVFVMHARIELKGDAETGNGAAI